MHRIAMQIMTMWMTTRAAAGQERAVMMGEVKAAEARAGGIVAVRAATVKVEARAVEERAEAERVEVRAAKAAKAARAERAKAATRAWIMRTRMRRSTTMPRR